MKIPRSLLLLLFLLSSLLTPLAAQQFGDFTYTSNGSAVTITGYTGSGGAVEIPDTIAGLPVTTIGNNSFQYKTSITSVTIPPTVTSIQNLAFSHSTGITNITIPSGVTTIGLYVFAGCSGLISFSVDSANASYSSNEGVLFDKAQTTLIQYPPGRSGTYEVPSGVTTIVQSAFSEMSGPTSVSIPASVATIQGGVFLGCRNLTSISVNSANPTYSTYEGALLNKFQTILMQYPCGKSGSYVIPASVATIWPYAFRDCEGLTAVTIPSSVTKIEYGAFRGCSGLLNLFIPASVTNIGDSAFTDCSGLMGISVETANPSYSSLDGVLFNKLRTTLIQYPGVGSGGYSIPPGVTTIARDAFIGCYGLTSVVIPGGVTTIGSQAFHSTGLSSVTFPSSLTNLEFFAFAYCRNLSRATFEGNAPSMGGSEFVSVTANFTVYFYDGASGFETPTWHGYPSQMLTGGGDATLADAVDAPDLVFTTGGAAPWLAQSAVTHDGTDAAASGDIDDWQESWLETTVTGPGTISFWWSVSSEMTFDLLEFRIDGTLQDSISGLIDWTQKTYSVPAGAHTLRWRYFKDSKTSLGSDTGWVDQVVWTPGGGGGDPAEDFTYTSNGFSITITGHTRGSGSLVIPATINGLPVTAIGELAFQNRPALTGITIPNGVIYIGDFAFDGCINLTSVTLPSGITHLGNNAFYDCGKLANVVIPDSVTWLGSSVFASCASLTGITIPAGVTSIGAGPFGNCAGLLAITVQEGNMAYSGLDGVLFNKNRTTLIQYPGGKTGGYTIPSSVTSISRNAFYRCMGLTSVAIPGSVADIGYLAFASCRGLTSVTIPASVTRIDLSAFASCTGLTAATFQGNAPAAFGSEVFANTAPGFTIYYYNGATGFTPGTWQGYSTVMLGAPGTGFSTWSVLASLPADKRGAGDRNGPLNLPNLLAYGMGLNPLEATPGDLPAFASLDSTNGRAAFRYRRAKNAPGVTLHPMISTGLSGWRPAEIHSSTVVHNGGDWEIIEIQVPAPPEGVLFFYLEGEE